MSIVSIENYKINNNKLEIHLDSSKFELDKTLEVVFRNRKDKDRIYYTPHIVKDEFYVILEVDLSDLDASQDNDIIDLAIKIKNREFRIHKDYNKMDKKYCEEHININNGVAVPYLTNKNELSIIYGEASDIFKRYCEVVNGSICSDHIEISNGKLEIEIKDLCYTDYSYVNVALINRTNKETRNLEFSFNSENKIFSIDISDLKTDIFYEIYQIILEVKIDNILKVITIESSSSGFISGQSNIILFAAENRELHIINATNGIINNIIGTSKNKSFYSELCIDDICLEKSVLKLLVNNASCENLIGEKSLVLKSINEDYIITLEEEHYSINNNEINIYLDLLDKRIFENIYKWQLMLKSYNKEKRLIEFKYLIKGINSISMKERYIKPIKLNNGVEVIVYISEENKLQVMSGDIEVYKDLAYKKVNGKKKIKNIEFKNNKLSFDVLELNKNIIEELNIVFKERKTKEVFRNRINISCLNENKIEIDVIELFQQFDTGVSRWDIYLEFVYYDTISVCRVGIGEENILPLNERYFSYACFDYENVLSPYLTNHNELSLVINTMEDIEKEKRPKIIKKASLNTNDIYIKDEILTFNIEYVDIIKANKISFYLEERENKEKYYFDNSSRNLENNNIKLNLIEFIEKYSSKTSRWNLFAEIIYDNYIEVAKIGDYKNADEIKFKKYFNTVAIENENVIALYLTKENDLSLVVRDERFYYNEKYSTKTMLHKLNMNKDIIKGEVEVKVPDVENYTVKGIIMKLRSKVEKEEYFLDFKAKNKEDGKKDIEFKIDLNKKSLKQFYWEFYVLLDIYGEKVYKRIEGISEKLKKSINHSVISNNYFTNDRCVIYPYITPKNVFFLAYRQMAEEESKKDKINELIAYPLYKLFKWYFDKKDIWMVYEKMSETAQDNSYYFFKYCYEKQHNKNVYYVIKKNSPDYSNLKGMEDRVIEFMSIKHLIYMCAAKLLVASETRGHCYVWRQQKGKVKEILNKKKFVFLQHGVTALKLNDSVLSKKSDSAVNLYVVTSNFERDIISKGLGYSNKEIIVTGFTRWDYLEDKSKVTNPKEIFLMPTWRGWLDEIPEEEFIETPYFKNYIEFLNSNKLHKILIDNNIKFNFYIHPKFKQYIGSFYSNCENIRIICFGEEKVNELLKSTSLLITDYSSVAWEVYYMGKPVVFYQFDIEDYNRLTGSYINMDEGLFGDRVFNADDLIKTVIDYVKNDFQEKEVYAEARSNYFAYIDNNNSERVYNEILNSKVLFENKTHDKSKMYLKLRKNKTIRSIWNLLKKNKYTRKIVVKAKKIFKK